MKLSWKRVFLTWLIVSIGVFHSQAASAGDLRITIPRRSQLTPVQRLNREGVAALNKHQFEKAKALFYKAYLFDPGDPFTLNNLGYISELEGQADRAQTFYALSSALPTEAVVDQASSPSLRGESLQNAIQNVHNLSMQINRANVEAVHLLSEGRAPEADRMLQRTLSLDPRNGFTLNNLGVAKESEGNFEEALRYYGAAAASRSPEGVVVTLDSAWRGKPVSELAAESARRLRERMLDVHAKAALLNLQGVSAINRNNMADAIQKFSQAYRLDPTGAFSLNNEGYLAELYGDLETAQDFYQKAQRANSANARVGLASRRTAERMAIRSVANESEDHVTDAMEAAQAANRRRTDPIRLKHRDNTPVVDQPPQPASPPQR